MIHHYMVKKILHEKRMLDLVAFHGFQDQIGEVIIWLYVMHGLVKKLLEQLD